MRGLRENVASLRDVASSRARLGVSPHAPYSVCDALFTAAQQRNMRLVAGKVLMDRHAPDGLRDDVEMAERDCRELIGRWHGTGRLAYAARSVRTTSLAAQVVQADT